jgi:hypothetical protein
MAMITGALAVMLSGCSVPEDLEAVDPAATEAAEQSPEADVAEVTDEETEEQEEPAEAQDIKVVESAFGKTADSDTWWYVVILDNPNPDAVFTYESIDIEALDKEGTILDSSSDYSTILPGKFAVQGTFFDVADGKISELNVRGPDGSTAEHADEIGSFRIGKAKAKFDDWSTDVSGTVASEFAKDQELVEVVVVARDSSGEIIDGDFTYIDRLPAGGKAQYSATFFGEDIPKDATFEVYASL